MLSGRSWSHFLIKLMKVKLFRLRNSLSLWIPIPLKGLRTIWMVLRSFNWNWVNVAIIFWRNMDNSLSWSWWIWEHPMMCYVLHSTPLGDCIRKMIRIIPLMYYVDYWPRINTKLLMKGSLVVSINLTWSRAREIKTIRKEDVLMFLVENMNVWTRKINWISRSHRYLGRIKRRRLVATMERWYMSRKHVGRKIMTWKRRWRNLKEMW